MIERDVVAGLTDALEHENWEIEAQRSPHDRYDVLATAPTGRRFLIEVKTGQGSAHFAALAQVERYAQELGGLEDQEVTPVLVTTQHVSPTLEAVAERVGVAVVELASESERVITAPYEAALARLRELASGA